MRALPLLVLALLLAGCSAPDEGPIERLADNSGSGSVQNTNALFSGLGVAPTSVDNSGAGIVVFSATVYDPNSETDIISIRFFHNASGFSSTHTVTTAERAATSEPATFGSDGWRVWTGTAADGYLYAKLQYTIPSGTAAASYAIGVSDTNSKSKVSYPVPPATANLTVSLPQVITVASAPVNASGVAQSGLSWGQWTGGPGDANVGSANYLKLTNTGGFPTPSVVVDFTPASFTGADGSSTVPIDGNVQFAWWEDATGTAPPSAGTYAWGPTSPNGSVTVTFGGAGRVIFVLYRIVSLPAPLPAQAYTATFTATDL